MDKVKCFSCGAMVPTGRMQKHLDSAKCKAGFWKKNALYFLEGMPVVAPCPSCRARYHRGTAPKRKRSQRGIVRLFPREPLDIQKLKHVIKEVAQAQGLAN